MGPAGIFTMGAIVHMHIDGEDLTNVKIFVEKVLKMEKLFDAENQSMLEDELLYGNAGYLYCLLLLKDKLGHQNLASQTENIDRVIHKVV
jgi:hypothetical protein